MNSNIKSYKKIKVILCLDKRYFYISTFINFVINGCIFFLSSLYYLLLVIFSLGFLLIHNFFLSIIKILSYSISSSVIFPLFVGLKRCLCVFIRSSRVIKSSQGIFINKYFSKFSSVNEVILSF